VVAINSPTQQNSWVTVIWFLQRESIHIRTGRDKIAETQLPPIEAFYNTLEDEPCTPKNYDRAREIWAPYNMKTTQNYHDHYLLSDVLLLADVFQNFKNSVYQQHHLDPLHFITLPSLAWASALKYT